MKIDVNYRVPGGANRPPQWGITTPQQLTVGTPYALILSTICNDPDGNILSISALSGTPPPGLVFNDTTDAISGTPSTPGNYSMSFRASDGELFTDITLQFVCLAADTTAPPAPSILSASVISPIQANLSWTNVVDPVIPGARTSGLAGFRIFRNGAFLKNVGLVLTYSDTTLTANTSYEYRIKSIDAAGNISEPWSAPASVTTVAGRKYHAGHWIAYLRGQDSNTQIINAINQAKAGASGALRGIQKRYTWRSLEPSKDVYNFDEIAADLVLAKNNGLMLMPFFEDKTFFNSENPGPDYMLPQTMVISTNVGTGMTMARWDATYTARFKLLMNELGKAFDTDPNFEGISIQETALGSPPNDGLHVPGPGKSYQPYSPTRYRDALIQQIQHCGIAFPSCRLFWHFNFMPTDGDKLATDGTYFNQVIQACLSNICMGGPDSLIERNGLWSRCYPWYPLNKDKVPIFIDYQPDSYQETRNPPIHNDDANQGAPYWSLEDEFQNSIGNNPDDVDKKGPGLYANYIFWTVCSTPVWDFNPHAISVMNTHKTFNIRQW